VNDSAIYAPCANPLEIPTRILLGPGPSDVAPRVLRAMGQPTIGHLDPVFVKIMDEVKEGLKSAFRTGNEMTFPVSAPGSAGMESCVVNLLEPGDTAIIGINGVFGNRMAENARRAGAKVVPVESPWGRPVDPARIREALQANPNARAVGFVHAETSTGVRSDAQAIAAECDDHGCLVIVDAVTSLAGIPLEIDAWGIDAVYSGSQKCLSCTPGLSPVSFSPRAMARIEARRHPVQSWFLDLSLVAGYWQGQDGGGGGRTYHHTAPVNAVYGLYESLRMLHEEGVEAAWARRQRMREGLCAGLDALGLELAVPAECRLPQLNAVMIPEGVNDADVRGRLLAEHGIEIGAGLGALKGKIWRVGLMGSSAVPGNVVRFLAAMEQTLDRSGAVRAAQAYFDRDGPR
jgi:alanine-glyoxylate transaminase / serine-glyoxylate transaminase / serine-pyruvate transaminase